MTQLPTQLSTTDGTLSKPPLLTSPPSDELRLRQLMGVCARNRWIFIMTLVAGSAVGFMSGLGQVPVYSAIATVQIDDRETNLPGIYKDPSRPGELLTQAEVLRSRSLAVEAVQRLNLQLRVTSPQGVARDALVGNIQLGPELQTGTYRLTRVSGRDFRVGNLPDSGKLVLVRAGDIVHLGGASFTLESAAAKYDHIDITLRSVESATNGVRGGLDVYQPARDARILKVRFKDPDPLLASQIANSIVQRFVEQRQGLLQADARSTVEFLRRQIDTVATQLAVAEAALRDYRERNRIVDAQTEANAEVSRVATLQTQRASLDGERAALTSLLQEVDAKAAQRQPGDPSPYRELMAFPTLLQSRAATEVLQALSNREEARSDLLSRRTPKDPDVQALDRQVEELEGQLRGVTATYLQSLTNQVKSLDANLATFSKNLSAIPEKELQVARLERQPKVLEEMYTLLQTRLKEAQISAAANDNSVRLVDPAVPPRSPERSRRMALLFTGVVGGLLVGGALALIRELRDHALHTRSDLERMTTLPVLGMIPRLRRGGTRVALIAEREKQRRGRLKPGESGRSSEGAALAPAHSVTPVFTFLSPFAEPRPPVNGRPEIPGLLGPVLQLTISGAGTAVAEAYGILQTNIAFSRPEGTVKVLVLSSPLPGEGKTTTAVNLGLTLAHRGMRVLLVDADLRRGTIHTILETKRDPGLSEVLAGAVPLSRAYRTVEVAGGSPLHVLTAGTSVAAPMGLLSSAVMRELLERWKQEFDSVIVDCPPVNLVADAAVLAAKADGVLLVARAGITEPGALSDALEQLEHARAPVLGVLLNDIDPKRDASYGGSYKYHDYGQYAEPAH